MVITSGTVTLVAGPGVVPGSVALKNVGDPLAPVVKKTSTALVPLFSKVIAETRADLVPPGLYRTTGVDEVRLVVADKFKTFNVVAIVQVRVRDTISCMS